MCPTMNQISLRIDISHIGVCVVRMKKNCILIQNDQPARMI